MISVIIPTFNDEKHGYIHKIFNQLTREDGVEVIVVDRQSEDQTPQLARKVGFTVLVTDINSRAGRINLGLQHARGDKILIHHPRTLLSPSAISELKQTQALWGAFTHRFDQSHPLLRFTSFWSNQVRGARGIYYLDHCLFFRRSFIPIILSLPEKDIFEDTEICIALRKIKAPIRLKSIATTSAVRFIKNGIWRQALSNQVLKWKYYLGYNDKLLNQTYEKHLEYNSKYEPRDS